MLNISHVKTLDEYWIFSRSIKWNLSSNGGKIIKYIQMSITKRVSADIALCECVCACGLKSASHAELAVLYMQIGISYDYRFCYI